MVLIFCSLKVSKLKAMKRKKDITGFLLFIKNRYEILALFFLFLRGFRALPVRGMSSLEKYVVCDLPYEPACWVLFPNSRQTFKTLFTKHTFFSPQIL